MATAKMAHPSPPNTEARFRSPDTMTRENWESMRNNLPNKIDEVMASFRDDKLEVTPRAKSAQVKAAAPEAPPPRASWPWFVAGAMAALVAVAIFAYWFTRPGTEPTLSTPPAKASEGTLAPPPDLLAPVQRAPSRPVAPPPVADKPAPAAETPPVAPEAEAAPKPAAKPKPAKKPAPAKPVVEEEHFTEDLTPLLRGQQSQ